MPTLQEVVNSTWRKEEDLKKLKSELSALERKVQLTLIPKQGVNACISIQKEARDGKISNTPESK